MTPMMNHQPPPTERLYTTAEVAAMARVTTRTVTRWAQKGLLRAKVTPGGARRFPESTVRSLLQDADQSPTWPNGEPESVRDAADREGGAK